MEKKTTGLQPSANQRRHPGAPGMIVHGQDAQNRHFLRSFSVYVPMRDGVRLAVDVHLPLGAAAPNRVPALVHLTRYWRSSRRPIAENPRFCNPAHWRDEPLLTTVEVQMLASGYAIVKVDVRGTGASYGFRKVEYGPVEARDGHDLVQWIVEQPWSDGNVGAYGISYTAATAEFLAANRHPAVKAVVPVAGGYLDHYKAYVRPFGLFPSSLGKDWGAMVGWMDSNAWKNLGLSVRPVDEDRQAGMLAAALAEHRKNGNVFHTTRTAVFKDDILADGLSLLDISTVLRKEQIEASGVAMFKMCSWLDAATADSVLLQFKNFSNPTKVLILATTHGGRRHASPYTVSDTPLPPVPSETDQWQMAIEFFDRHLKAIDNDVDQWPPIVFYNLGEERFKYTRTWPPKGTRKLKLFMSAGYGLSTHRPDVEKGEDAYTVDFDVTLGPFSRWMTQNGAEVLNLNDLSAMDEKMLTYTSPPLRTDLQITGHPVVTLYVSSTHADGAFIAHLEDVAADGQSIYITEGGLRAIHRKISKNPYLKQATPYHSFESKDAVPLVPGKTVRLTFEMVPTSVLIKAGHRIRLSIAGADRDNFDRVPATGTPTIRVARSRKQASFLELPVVEPHPFFYRRLVRQLC